MTRRTRRGFSAFGEVVLTVLAGAGAVCLVLVVLAVTMHITLIMFKTGSMSPTIPAGSLAMVREIPAGEARIGDIVTIDRPGALPVTHRVTSIADAGGGQHTITMKGDANLEPDPLPYTVNRVRLVIAHVPELARVIGWFSDARVMGGVAVAASVLVTWAFWPRDGADRPAGRHLAPRTARSRRGARRSRTQRGARAARSAVVVLVGGGALVGSLVPAQSAHAAAVTQPVERVVTGTQLELISVTDAEQNRRMTPGASAVWQVGVRAVTAEPGEIEVSLSGIGDPAAGFEIDVAACPIRWADDECAAAPDELVARRSAPVGDDVLALQRISSERESWLRIAVHRLTDVPSAGQLELRLQADGFGDEVSVGQVAAGPLAVTGTTVAGPLGAAALAVGAGLLAARLGRRIRAEERR